jgi:hypothetical protein
MLISVQADFRTTPHESLVSSARYNHTYEHHASGWQWLVGMRHGVLRTVSPQVNGTTACPLSSPRRYTKKHAKARPRHRRKAQEHPARAHAQAKRSSEALPQALAAFRLPTRWSARSKAGCALNSSGSGTSLPAWFPRSLGIAIPMHSHACAVGTSPSPRACSPPCPSVPGSASAAFGP